MACELTQSERQGREKQCVFRQRISGRFLPAILMRAVPPSRFSVIKVAFRAPSGALGFAAGRVGPGQGGGVQPTRPLFTRETCGSSGRTRRPLPWVTAGRRGGGGATPRACALMAPGGLATPRGVDWALCRVRRSRRGVPAPPPALGCLGPRVVLESAVTDLLRRFLGDHVAVSARAWGGRCGGQVRWPPWALEEAGPARAALSGPRVPAATAPAE
jgi:hypothetical protein